MTFILAPGYLTNFQNSKQKWLQDEATQEFSLIEFCVIRSMDDNQLIVY